MILQIDSLKPAVDALQKKHGHRDYVALYGTGCTKNPKVMFLFMNPTAKNLTVHKNWKGLRAPWVGLKNTWKLLYQLEYIDKTTNDIIQKMKPGDWTNDFAEKIYTQVAKNKAYLTNLARCTQPDARYVADVVFRESREITLQEIQTINPKIIIAFGNQVATNLLEQNIAVSHWRTKKVHLVIGKKTFDVYPTYYPVGMGLRNMAKACEDIKTILSTYA